MRKVVRRRTRRKTQLRGRRRGRSDRRHGRILKDDLHTVTMAMAVIEVMRTMLRHRMADGGLLL